MNISIYIYIELYVCAVCVPPASPRPRTASFPVHAMIVSHYMNGAWFPKGGPLSLARPLVSTIFKGGGAVLVRAAVQQIQARAEVVRWNWTSLDDFGMEPLFLSAIFWAVSRSRVGMKILQKVLLMVL